MSIAIIVLMLIVGFWILRYFTGLFYMSQATTNPVAWRIQMANKIRHDTLKYYRQSSRLISIQGAHTKAINSWYSIILKSGNPSMYQLYTEMMQDEFPRQLEMIRVGIYGENYKTEYSHIKNKEEMLEIIKSERAASGDISNLEKMCIDSVLPSLCIENEEELLVEIPSILVGTDEMGLPMTFEEVRAYISERLGIKQSGSVKAGL